MHNADLFMIRVLEYILRVLHSDVLFCIWTTHDQKSMCYHIFGRLIDNRGLREPHLPLWYTSQSERVDTTECTHIVILHSSSVLIKTTRMKPTTSVHRFTNPLNVSIDLLQTSAISHLSPQASAFYSSLSTAPATTVIASPPYCTRMYVQYCLPASTVQIAASAASLQAS